MAGTPDREVMSVREAKARLLAPARESGGIFGLLSSPLVRGGALLLLGAALAHRFRARSKGDFAAAVIGSLTRAGMAAAPLLIGQFVRGVAGRVAAQHHNGTLTKARTQAPPAPAREV